MVYRRTNLSACKRMKELKLSGIHRSVYTENAKVRANRIDARVVDKKRKRVAVIEMSCRGWITDRLKKIARYGPLR